jgi:hypothetical protein
MNKWLSVIALPLAVAVLACALSGCKSDPHETHISTTVAMPR